MEISGDVEGADSITRTLDNINEDWSGTVTWKVATPVHYAPHQEYGTVHHGAQPFLRPALYSTSRNVRGIMAGQGDLNSAVEALAAATLSGAEDRAPVDTGRLQDSLYMERID